MLYDWRGSVGETLVLFVWMILNNRLTLQIMTSSPFPYFTSGTVVHGFGRGSKKLGCPTGTEIVGASCWRSITKDSWIFFRRSILANFDEDAVEKLPSAIYQGVYYGWAQLLTKESNEIYKMVTSVGTNPFYNGEKKTMVSGCGLRDIGLICRSV